MGWQTHRGKAVLVHILTLMTYVSAWFFPFPPPPGASVTFVVASAVSLVFAFMAVTLAMQNRYDGMPWAATHHEQAIRTLIIGFVLWTVASALQFITPALAMVSFVVHIAVALWAALRSVVGIVLALMRKPTLNARGWLL